MHFSRAFDVDRSNCHHCSKTAPLIARPTTLFFRGYTNGVAEREREREDAEERKREGKKERWLSFFPLRLRGSILIIFRPLCIPSMAGAGQRKLAPLIKIRFLREGCERIQFFPCPKFPASIFRNRTEIRFQQHLFIKNSLLYFLNIVNYILIS